MKTGLLNFSIKIILDDGTAVKFKIESGRVHAQKIHFRLFPESFWKFDPPVGISLSLSLFFAHETGEINKGLLNIILASISDCSTFSDLNEKLNKEIAQQLDAFLHQKSTKYYTLDEIVEIFNTPKEVQEIIQLYGSALMNNFKNRRLVAPLSSLPYPRDQIANALKEALMVTKSEKRKNKLYDLLFWLNFFLQVNTVPEDQQQNAILWAKLIKDNKTIYSEAKSFFDRNPKFFQEFFAEKKR